MATKIPTGCSGAFVALKPEKNDMIALRFIFSVVLLSATSLFAQQTRDFGSWRTYVNTERTIGVVGLGEYYYAATTGGLLQYNRFSGELRAISTIDGLSAISPTTIAAAPGRNLIFLGYSDGAINYFSEIDDISTLTDIKRNTTYPDKSINALTVSGDLLYVATNFGIVVYDLETLRPIADAAQFGDSPNSQPVLDLAVYDGRIFLLVEGGNLYSIDQDFPNLRDPTAWEAETERSGLSEAANIEMIESTGFGLFAQTPSTVLSLSDGSWQEYTPFAGRDWSIFGSEEFLASSKVNGCIVIDAQGNTESFSIDGVINSVGFAEKGEYMAGAVFRGLFRYSQDLLFPITQEGPGSNDCIRIAAGNGELYIAPRGYDRIFVPTPRGDGIFYYNHHEGAWDNLSATDDLPEEVNESFARVFYDPATREAFVGAFGEGMVILKDGEFVEAFNCENSTLSNVYGTCTPNDRSVTRVSGIAKDLNGNLYVTTDRGIPPLLVRNSEGEWFEAGADLFPSNPEDNHITDVMVDSYGTVWLVNYNRNLWAYTSNGTPNEYNDGRLLTFRTGVNQGGLPSDQVFTVAEDKRGFIWVGTAQGVSVIFDPFSVSQGILVEGNEPVYESRGLLNNTAVNVIRVDGANRKWIGTDDGVYLVSENGDDVLLEFNSDNSPLLADRVTDIAIDQTTGEVYFATVAGVISYQGDAVQGGSACDDVLVYPNPVFTDYTGQIAIRGMTDGSSVKITTVSGLLVTELTSNGGIATWDGLDNRGRKVRSGVYLALISNQNEEEACAGKFVVIERN